MSDFIKIISFVKPYKYLIILNFIFNLFSVIFSLFSISLIIPVLGILFGTIEFKPDEINNLKDISILSFEYLKIWIYSKISILIEQKNELYSLGVICFFIVLFSILKNLTRYLALFFFNPLKK